MWYLGTPYFVVPAHVGEFFARSQLQFGKGYYVTYQSPLQPIVLAEVLECLIDMSNGDQLFVGRLFVTLQDVQNHIATYYNRIAKDIPAYI